MGSVTLMDVPLDAWAVVFQHVPDRDLVGTFRALQDAGVFDRTGLLDVFWTVVPKMKSQEPAAFASFPDASLFHEGTEALCSMGVPRQLAQRAVGDAQGDLAVAMHLLGWDA